LPLFDTTPYSISHWWSVLKSSTVWVKKNNNRRDFWSQIYNFSKCRPIYKILSLSDSWGNFM